MTAAVDHLQRILRSLEAGKPVAGEDARVLARLLHWALASPETPDPRRPRRHLLRRAWREHFPDLPRTTAARMLASAWASWSPGPADALPGSLSAIFDRLHRAGFRPIGWRQMADDLDPALDPPAAKSLQNRPSRRSDRA